MAVRDLARGVGAGGSVAVVIDMLVGTGQLGIEVLAFLVGNVELLLPLVATLQGRLAPEVGWLPENALQKALFAIAALYVGVLVYRLIRRWNDN